MSLEFVLHGVPQGHDVWGALGDEYYESFYGIGEHCKGAKTVLVVEIRKDTTGYCSYYTYIRPQNVVAQGGRTGSYFGMSLKIVGEYCTDVYSLYQLLDKIYEEKIVGAVIARSGNTEEYTVASFSDAEIELRNIAQLLENQLKTKFEDDFDEIDSSFTKQHASSSVYCNVDDVNSEAFFKTTRVYGKVFVSPEYPSKDAIITALSSSDKKYQTLKADSEKQIADLQNENTQIPQLKTRVATLGEELADAQKKVQELQASVNTLNTSNSSLNQQLNKARQECEQLKKVSNVGQVAEQLEPTLAELLEIMRSAKMKPGSTIVQPIVQTNKDEHYHSSHHHEKSVDKGFVKFIPIVIASILGLVVVILLWRGISSGPKINDLKKQNIELEQEVLKLRTENNNLQKEIKKISKIQPASKVLIKNEKYPEASFEIYDGSNNLVTDVLKRGKRYIIKCVGVNKSGQWRADGFNISNKKNNPA